MLSGKPDVALKLCPKRSPECMARFKREAEVLVALKYLYFASRERSACYILLPLE